MKYLLRAFIVSVVCITQSAVSCCRSSQLPISAVYVPQTQLGQRAEKLWLKYGTTDVFNPYVEKKLCTFRDDVLQASAQDRQDVAQTLHYWLNQKQPWHSNLCEKMMLGVTALAFAFSSIMTSSFCDKPISYTMIKTCVPSSVGSLWSLTGGLVIVGFMVVRKKIWKALT